MKQWSEKMTDLIEILSKLTEQEKEELKQRILNENMNADADNVIFCPKCKSFHVVKNGKVSGNQRFICKECGCHFTEYKNTIFNKTKKDMSLWKSYIKEMFEGKSLKQIAEDLHICIQTSFRWRHKIMKVIEDKRNSDGLNGIVEADETLVLLLIKENTLTVLNPGNVVEKQITAVNLMNNKVFWSPLIETKTLFQKFMEMAKFQVKMSNPF